MNTHTRGRPYLDRDPAVTLICEYIEAHDIASLSEMQKQFSSRWVMGESWRMLRRTGYLKPLSLRGPRGEVLCYDAQSDHSQAFALHALLDRRGMEDYRAIVQFLQMHAGQSYSEIYREMAHAHPMTPFRFDSVLRTLIRAEIVHAAGEHGFSEKDLARVPIERKLFKRRRRVYSTTHTGRFDGKDRSIDSRAETLNFRQRLADPMLRFPQDDSP